ncbi:hypothetical protein H6F38_09165 [Paenibacillus sp. EKM208P]|nr:hypothetical protein H6F38_09165 [Paenibacillus sp. EKM208P]
MPVKERTSIVRYLSEQKDSMNKAMNFIKGSFLGITFKKINNTGIIM